MGLCSLDAHNGICKFQTGSGAAHAPTPRATFACCRYYGFSIIIFPRALRTESISAIEGETCAPRLKVDDDFAQFSSLRVNLCDATLYTRFPRGMKRAKKRKKKWFAIYSAVCASPPSER